ncbi:cardiolipin synthase [Clostridiales Family XIII bacterium PM5-7]
MKEILGKIFNRLTITLLLILVQLGWFALLLIRLSEYASWISMAFTIGGIIMALFVIWRDDNPAYKIGWILLICIFPVLGASMYVFFGNKRPAKFLMMKIDPVDKAHREEQKAERDVSEYIDSRLMDTVSYITKKGPFPPWVNTKTKYYPLGEDAFADMLVDLRQSKQFIFMEYFILAEGEMWDKIFAILEKKAAQGLDVRVMYDDFGSINRLPKQFKAKLNEAGIKVMPFNPVMPIASLVYNNRDHRKILVIDGYIGYSGGYNIADEYINKFERFGHWKDTGIRLEGEAVWNFTLMFLNMWNAFMKTEEDYSPFRPHVWHPDEFEHDGIVQPYGDTPLDDENLGENVYLEILGQARDYVYIFTPYLIIDNEMKTALELAAKRGVDVRIVTPAIPDKKMVFRLTRSYYAPLIKAGVRIYEYTPGFMHAKSYLSDDKIGVVGTINMDYRSLFLHFECGTLMLGCNALHDLKLDCMATMGKSKEIRLEDCRQGFFGALFEAVLRVLSPLL